MKKNRLLLRLVAVRDTIDPKVIRAVSEATRARLGLALIIIGNNEMKRSMIKHRFV